MGDFDLQRSPLSLDAWLKASRWQVLQKYKTFASVMEVFMAKLALRSSPGFTHSFQKRAMNSEVPANK